MRAKKIRKIIIMMLLFANIINSLYASTIEEKLGTYSIYSHDDPISYVSYNNIRQKSYEYYYLNEKGNEETVYCLNIGIPGAEANEGYQVSANEAIQDKKISSILANAYPYKSLEELGVETVSEARFASQFAVWTYINGFQLSYLRPNETKYQRVVDAIHKIYHDGLNSEYVAVSPVQIYETRSIAQIDKINPDYYSKEYKIVKNTNVKSIVLKSSSKEVLLTDEKNNLVEDISSLQTFKVLVPIYQIDKDSNINLNFEIKLKENVSLLGISTVENMQNVAITLAPIRINNIKIGFEIKKQESKLKIVKVDKEDHTIKIPGVKFKISNVDTKKEYGEFITDLNGEINLDMIEDLKLNEATKLLIEEVEVPKEYYIDYDNNTKEIEVKLGNQYEVNFENEKAKGKVKIVKTSLRENELSNIKKDKPLAGAKFAIYDKEGKKVDEITTDEVGIGTSKELLVGSYSIQEIEAPEYYKISDNKIEFEIKKHGEEIQIHVKNDNIEVPKRLPNTGC